MWAVNRAQTVSLRTQTKNQTGQGDFVQVSGRAGRRTGEITGRCRAAQWLQGAGAGVQGCSYKKPKKRAVRTGKTPPPPKAKVVFGRGSAAQNRGGTLNPIISDVDLLPLLYEKGNDKNYVGR